VTRIGNRMKEKSVSAVAGQSRYFRQAACRSNSRAQNSARSPSGATCTSSGQVALPCTRICSGRSSPLAVGSENNNATRPSRRTLEAFCGYPSEVVSRKVPSGRDSPDVGHAITVPSLPMVASSQVR
jgi:hypothetical protein